MNKIILSADDFARTHERNLAIDYSMKNGLIKSVALLVGSQFTKEAIKMAREGGYIKDVHCHLNLISNVGSGAHLFPLSETYKKCSLFCQNGEFIKSSYYKPDFIRYIGVTFSELETQYLRFIDLTDNMANNNHIDFHIYNNISFPAAVAYRMLIKKYKIKSARYFGEHHKMPGLSLKYKLGYAVSGMLNGNNACVAKSCNVDFYLTKQNYFSGRDLVETYVHPDYVNGILLDNTFSIFGHTKRPLQEHIDELKALGNIEFISWADV